MGAVRICRVFALAVYVSLFGYLHGADGPSATTTSQDLVAWIRQTGKPSVLRAGVAELLNLGSRPIAVQERAFKIGEQTHLLGVSVESHSEKMFMFIIRISDADNTAMIWGGTDTGKLSRALFVDPSQGIIRLRVEEQIGEFLAEREFFRRKMRETQRL